MSSRARLVLAVVCGVAVLVSATVAAGAWLVYAPGSLYVRVHERDGSDVAIRVPAIVLRAVVAMIPDRALQDGGEELRDAVPFLAGAADALDRVDDAVLVEVERPEEHVRIEKAGGRIIVSVESPDASVRLEVPYASARWLADRLDRLPRADGRRRV